MFNGIIKNTGIINRLYKENNNCVLYILSIIKFILPVKFRILFPTSANKCLKYFLISTVDGIFRMPLDT